MTEGDRGFLWLFRDGSGTCTISGSETNSGSGAGTGFIGSIVTAVLAAYSLWGGETSDAITAWKWFALGVVVCVLFGVGLLRRNRTARLVLPGGAMVMLLLSVINVVAMLGDFAGVWGAPAAVMEDPAGAGAEEQVSEGERRHTEALGS